MKKIVIVLMIFFATSANAQSYMNYKESEVRSKLYPKKITTSTMKDGSRCLEVKDNIETRWWYFDQRTATCNLHILVPHSIRTKSMYIEMFNKEFVIIDSKHWKIYNNGIVVNIELFHSDGQDMFGFTEDRSAEE